MQTSPSRETAHPIKVERHDVPALRHHTNTGIRPVRTYRETGHGLYVERDFYAHPRIRHWQAHLLPMHDLVVCRYDFHGRREHDYHLDVACITRDGGVWAVRDLYLDIILHDGLMAEIVDTDELLAAREADFISEREMHRAVAVAHHTLASLARAHYSLREWQQEQHLTLDWAARQTASA
ncbi:DUF402 domain-containing protein [Deinococcus sp.]|uniref:DUF402 domain-containing protein n=1 Tax=Deinococcus sp. TaxID=47478 RepID=UPI00286997DB|nr:DUF402 domain-containing protein [Deinococcus sp.]